MNSQLEQVSDLVERAIAGLSEAELAWHPEGKWSSAGILEHLARAFGGTAKGMQRTLTSGSPDCRALTAKEWLQIAVVVHCGYFPKGRKSPEQVVPRGLAAADAVKAIRENLRSMDQALSDCENKFGTRRKVAVHPILGPLNISEWRKFHLVHTRHHMRQIHDLRRQFSAVRPAKASA
jgi:hypothetical protein